MIAATGPADGHRPTVLIVDDDAILRQIIGTNLQLGGFDVLSAPDGPTALALLDDHLPDVVVLDAVMPLMDGYATLGRIRRHATASHVPVIVLTAGGNGGDVLGPVKILEAGADDSSPNRSRPRRCWPASAPRSGAPTWTLRCSR